MKQLLRTLCTACLIAAPTLAAHATDYYLRSASTDSYTNLREAFKFTQIGNTNEYQLAVEFLSSEFYIGSKNDDVETQLHFGTDNAANDTYISSNKDQTDSTPIKVATIDVDNINLVNSSDSKTIKSWEFGQYSQIKHMLLTLTIDSEDANKATLKIEHITNSNLKPGVPSFLYVADMTAANSNGNNLLKPENRLIKGEGDQYSVHFDQITGPLIIKDGPCLFTNCMVLGSDNTTTLIKYDTVENQFIEGYDGTEPYEKTTGLFYEVCGRSTIGGDAVKKYVLIGEGASGTFSHDLDLFQLTNGSGKIRFGIDDSGSQDLIFRNVTFNFKYDISTREEYTNYDEYILGTEHNNNDGIYNGQLTIDLGDLTGDSKNFAVVLGSSSYESEIVMAKTSEMKTDSNGNYYVEYSCTIPGDSFDDSFYIEGYDGATLATSTETTLFGGTEAAAKAIETWVSHYKYKVGDEEVETALVEFPKSASTINSAVPEGSKDEEGNDVTLYPYYAISTKPVTVIFRYNLTDPTKSLVYVSTEGTMTGAESIIVDGEDAPVEYYNLSGVRVDGSVPGLYICRQGSKVSKVIIK
jgi:hypothetical protein